MKWILFVVAISGSSHPMQTAEFNSQTACQNAADQLMQDKPRYLFNKLQLAAWCFPTELPIFRRGD